MNGNPFDLAAYLVVHGCRPRGRSIHREFRARRDRFDQFKETLGARRKLDARIIGLSNVVHDGERTPIAADFLKGGRRG